MILYDIVSYITVKKILYNIMKEYIVLYDMTLHQDIILILIYHFVSY